MATTIIKKKAPVSKKGKTLSKTTKAVTKKAVAKKAVAKKTTGSKAVTTKAKATTAKATKVTPKTKGKTKVASKATVVKTQVVAPKIGMDADAGYEAIKSVLWTIDRSLHRKATLTKAGLTFPVSTKTWAFIAHPDHYRPHDEDGWVVGWTTKSNKTTEIEDGYVYGSRSQVKSLVAQLQRMYAQAQEEDAK